MGTWNQIASGDYRNHDWTFSTGSVTSIFEAWNNDDDLKYVKNPAHKGRAAVTFPTDPTDLPEGAVITNVSVHVRARREVGITDPVALTVNLLASDDTSRFTTRDIYLNDTITDYEVGNYDRDPMGLPWDIYRINKLIAQTWVFGTLANLLRLYKCWIKVTYRTRPIVTLLTPSGNQGTSSPTVSWTYTQADGDIQKSAEYKIFQKTVSQGVSFSPNRSTYVYRGEVEGDLTSFVLPTALPAGDYVIYLRATSDHNATSNWASKSFGVQAPIPGVPTVSGVADSSTSSVALTIQDTSNLLTAAQANWENSSDAIEYTTTNCTVARDTTTFLSSVGSASYKLTSSSAATMAITSSYVDCAESKDVTIRASFATAVSARTVNMVATFYDSSYASLGTITATGTDSTAWVSISQTGTTPANTKYVQIKLEVASPGSAEVHNVDAIGIMYGTGSPWTDGGHLSYNILDSAYSSSPGLASWTAGPSTLVSSITPTGTGNRAPNALRLTCNPTAADISFVNAGTVFTSTSSTKNVTLNTTITGLANSDTLIAIVTSYGNTGTINPPTGWTLVNTAATESTTQYTLYKLANSEPASYTATLATNATRIVARVSAYRNVHPTDPFIDHGISTQADSTPLAFKSAQLNNTDPKAWRLTAVSVNDNAASGSLTARQTADGGIAFVGQSVPWTTTSKSTTSYTINKPSGVALGHLMLAFVSVGREGGAPGTISTPSGWTLVRSTVTSNGGNDTRLAVFSKIATGSEPSTYTGTITNSSGPIVTFASAYSSPDGTTPVLTDAGTSSNGGTNVLATGTVNNTDSRNWRVTAFGAYDTSSGFSWSLSGEIERLDTYARHTSGSWWDTQYDTTGLAVYDSNGPISAGNTSKTGTMSQSFETAVSWIGIIKADPTAPATPPAETERYESAVGSSDPWVTQAVYDSAAVVSTGTQQMTATFLPGSGTDLTTALMWTAILRPTDANALVVGATMTNKIDISKVSSDVLEYANNKVTFVAHFMGSEVGTPYLRLYFYRANTLLDSALAVGTDFGTTDWTRSAVTFDIPEGTTKIQGDIYSPNHTLSSTTDVDGLSIAFGEVQNFYRGGSYRTAQPIWAIPVIQYADDNGDGVLDWQDLPGVVPAPPVYDPSSGLSSYTDEYPKPLIDRSYRVQTKAYGLQGDIFMSDYSEVITISPTANSWWLKDIVDPTNNMELPVRAENFEVTTINTTNVFQPLGEQYPVVLTEGYKADEVELTMVMQKDDWIAFKKLINLGRSLFLQSDQDLTWWVRPVEDLSAETLVSINRRTDPYRYVTQKFVEVKPEL